ncbi:multiheme c-type cytochrome [Muricauda sp. MAR_2010_75]|uniref:multiheme c-type cytochrome n=1 Tax=Allomuricauda sp. MAR_2010_75 TaxID=1250232 RepID=UPI0009E08F0A|nr:multiheme c-type cytochrome [Muricauda sp. MAR_2010_75]
MKFRKRFIYLFFVVMAIGAVLLVVKFYNSIYVSPYISIEPIAVHGSGKGFAGSNRCIGCHKDIYQSHMETAHFLTSRVADSASIEGSFAQNNSYLLNDEIIFLMRSKEDGFYQEAYSRSDSTLIDSKKMDIVIGSSTKGQSYLNWQGDELYQLQVSYFKPSESWVNSPNYPNGIFAPNRPILQRCLECHVTFAKSRNTFNKPHSYDRSQLIYGIDCERCHGPANEHVNHHLSNPNETEAQFILSYSDLTQKQKLQSCALCHSGTHRHREEIPFSFMTGDTLMDFPNPEYDRSSLESLDVHGNQYGLLLASSCFKGSKSMDCTSCHDPHKNQRGDFKGFNAKCIACHQGTGTGGEISCSLGVDLRKSKDNNCVECHMPLTPSKSMSIYDSKDSMLVPVEIRTHLIGIYK